ncbi:MAG: class I SAM-dependent methyltransferase [Oscillospiraceae bacterium]|nr:class I SAM-dependent methyltransferase [Oscillospiraceae bacterium]
MNATELDHVLFFRQRDTYEQAMNALWATHGPSESFTNATRAWRLQQIPDKAAFLARIEDYAQHGAPDPRPIRQTDEDIPNAFDCATKQSGEKRIAMFRNSGWAIHLDDYAAAVHAPGTQTILELATGAGMGTYAVLNQLPAQSSLISMDFDFICTQNAIGIAKALGVEERVAALCANHWFMPFCDGLFSTVCTHYGLDESCEVPAVLAEIARVLRPGGQFVVQTRMNPWHRQGSRLAQWTITEAEAPAILRQARLYAGPDDLIETAATCGLSLTSRKNYTPEDSHHRALMTFEKTNH